MACCCKGGKSGASASSCLGRCDLPKHKCLDRTESRRKGMVPKHMGWLYTAKDSPDFQLRCGWRPGHIFCPVLRKIEQHNCMKVDCCSSACSRPPCTKPSCCPIPQCLPISCPSPPGCCKQPPPGVPLIRVARHGGQYTLSTAPPEISNAPSGPYPLKYVLDTDDEAPKDAKFSVEAKFNDYHFDYTTSNSSFVLDFTPPEPKCSRPCGKPCGKKVPCPELC